MSDLGKFVDTFATPKPKFRRRLGTVLSVQSDYTITVTVAGSSSDYPISSVKYFGHYPPTPGAQVWLDTDGIDLIAVGAVAGLGGVAHAARWEKNANQSAPNSSTLITFGDQISDPANLFDNANDQYVAILPGLYHIVGGLTWSAVTDKEFRSVTIRVNGSAKATIRQENIGHATHQLSQVVSTIYPLAAGDTVALYANQGTGATLTAGMQADSGTFFAIAYIGPRA